MDGAPPGGDGIPPGEEGEEGEGEGIDGIPLGDEGEGVEGIPPAVEGDGIDGAPPGGEDDGIDGEGMFGAGEGGPDVGGVGMPPAGDDEGTLLGLGGIGIDWGELCCCCDSQAAKPAVRPQASASRAREAGRMWKVRITITSRVLSMLSLSCPVALLRILLRPVVSSRANSAGKALIDSKLNIFPPNFRLNTSTGSGTHCRWSGRFRPRPASA